MSRLYLYALLDRRPRAGALRGMMGERLLLLPGEGFWIAASRMAVPPASTARALRGHDRTVRRLAQLAEATLPVRFGSLVPETAALALFYGQGAAAVRDALAAVALADQMTLRLSGGRTAARPARLPGGPGTRYLRARLGGHWTRRERDEIRRVRDRLTPLVRAQRLTCHAPERRPLLATLYHLVDRGSHRAYRVAIRAVTGDLGAVRAAVSGPWPAYAFAPEPFA